MTHDYKSALDALEYIKDVLFNFKEHTDLELNLQFDTLRSALQLAQEAEQVRRENERLIRENEVYVERHKAWESCVYAVGLPMMKAIRGTEYGDAVPPIPVVNKITDLLDECLELRKERDELAQAIDNIRVFCCEPRADDDFEKIDKIAKKVRNENG